MVINIAAHFQVKFKCCNIFHSTRGQDTAVLCHYYRRRIEMNGNLINGLCIIFDLEISEVGEAISSIVYFSPL